MLLRRLVVAVLTSLCLSAQASVTPGIEHPVSASSAGPSYGYQRTLSVATDGEEFLTLWLEQTPGREGVYATVMNESGALRPSIPSAIVRGLANARAVWTGNEYLVVVSQANATTALRLNRDGQVVSGPAPTGLPAGSIWDLAWNGSSAMAVVGTDQKTTVAFLDGMGYVTQEAIELPGQPWWGVRVAEADRAFIAVWFEMLEPPDAGGNPLSRVVAARVTTSGAETPVELLPPTRKYVGLDVGSARTGDDVGVAVMLSDAQVLTDQLHRYVIDGDTVAVTADPVLNMNFLNGSVEVVWTPDGFVAGYASYGPASGNGAGTGTFLTRVRFGSTFQRDIIMVEVPDYELNLTANNRAVVAVWGFFPIRATVFDSRLTDRRLDVRPLTVAPIRQTSPAAASGDGVILQTWVEPTTFSEGQLMARRFDTEGNALDPEPLRVGFTTAVFATTAVFTGEVWLIAWQTSSGVDAHVYYRRMRPNGTFLDFNPIDLGVGSEPAMAFNGSVAALVLKKESLRGHDVIRFSRAGERLDATRIPVAEGRTYEAAIATNGQEFLVVWTVNRNSVFARRLDATATPMEAAPLAIAQAGGEAHMSPAVASRGEDFLVVYTDFKPIPMVDPPPPDPFPEPTFRTRAKRVLRTGVLADTTAAQEGVFLGEGKFPSVVPAGEGYVVTFVDQLYRGEQQPQSITLRGVATDDRGAPMSSARTIARYESDTPHTSLVAAGAVWAAYPRIAEEADGQQRVFLREVTVENTPGRRRRARR